MTDYKKFLYAIAAVSAAAMLASCDPVNPEPGPDPVDPEPEPVTLDLSFVLPSSGPKTSWAAGDQIVVHGEYAAQQVTVTLEAGDISSDGKSARKSVSGLFPYMRTDCASNLYAEWPADAVTNLTHCFFYSMFNTTSSPILAACNDAENSFKFEEILGVLSFSTGSEAFDSFTISANKKESLGYSFMQVKITDTEKNYKQYVGEPLLELDVKSGKTQNYVYLPAGTSVEGGVLIKFRKGGEFIKSYRSTEPFAIERGKVTDLGDISEEIKEYINPFSDDVKDLDTEGNANCYMVGETGKYKFKAVLGNVATSFFMDVADAIVLWETWNDDSDVEEGSVVASVAYAEDYVILTMPETLHPGNAVVAIRDEDENILWSWHIWVPATPVSVNEYGGIMGAPLMDRNLGALVATVAGDEVIDPLSYGMVYQWGRKDPFVNSHTALKNTLATWVGADEEVAPGQISLAESIANPRLLGHIDNGNWMNDIDETLWGAGEGKSIYDPCPPGYRVPVRNTSLPFWSGDLSAQAGWAVNNASGWLAIGDPAAVFPIAGYRDDYDVGGMAKVGARTLYWNAGGSEQKGYGADLRYDKGTFNGGGSAPKARLGSVRCVAE